MKERYTGAVLLCYVLLSAGARGLSIHDWVSIQICRRCWRRGRKKTDRKKPSRFVSFVFWGETENREKPTEKNDFRFSVHNPAHTICYLTMLQVSRDPAQAWY